MGYSPGSWVETEKLWEDFIEKHIPGGAGLQPVKISGPIEENKKNIL